jgi:hypothetical protein
MNLLNKQALVNIEFLRTFAELVSQVKKHRLEHGDSRDFKIDELKALYPGDDDFFDWLPQFFGVPHNRTWLESECKITSCGFGKKRLWKITKGGKEISSRIRIPTICKKNPQVKGLVLLEKDFLRAPLPAVIYLPHVLFSPVTEELVLPHLVDAEDSDDEDDVRLPFQTSGIPMIITPDEPTKKHLPTYCQYKPFDKASDRYY